ncbi:glycosyltransferase family 9 protein [Pseudomonas graminis]
MKNILIIRRDNIGDLVCTTPLIEGVKTTFPDANIYLLINTVSQGVVQHNPHIEHTFVYRKAKHAAGKLAKIRVYFERLKMFLKLRRIMFDAAILANPAPCKYSLRLAKMAGAKHIIGADTGDRAITVPFKRTDFHGTHQVEMTYSYLSALTDTSVPIPPVRMWLTELERQQARSRIEGMHPGEQPGLAVHISNRREKGNWPLENYTNIIRLYLREHSFGSVLIFWSPQGTLAPDDVGDQHRAEQILAACQSSRVSLYPTSSIRELVAAFECCDRVLCSDGGQMHLAAAVNKKQVVLFSETRIDEWHPWTGQHFCLQAPSGDCADISVDEVWHNLNRLNA